jgi:hypothetical protein
MLFGGGAGFNVGGMRVNFFGGGLLPIILFFAFNFLPMLLGGDDFEYEVHNYQNQGRSTGSSSNRGGQRTQSQQTRNQNVNQPQGGFWSSNYIGLIQIAVVFLFFMIPILIKKYQRR